jgi:hypothetical protein
MLKYIMNISRLWNVGHVIDGKSWNKSEKGRRRIRFLLSFFPFMFFLSLPGSVALASSIRLDRICLLIM